jgi:hypothetical protein
VMGGTSGILYDICICLCFYFLTDNMIPADVNLYS